MISLPEHNGKKLCPEPVERVVGAKKVRGIVVERKVIGPCLLIACRICGRCAHHCIGHVQLRESIAREMNVRGMYYAGELVS